MRDEKLNRNTKHFFHRPFTTFATLTLLFVMSGCGPVESNSVKLQDHAWTWLKTIYNNDTSKEPKQSGAFTLTFSDDNRVNGTTDCNRFFGPVTVKDHKLSFAEHMAMTRMFCEGSQEMEFIGMLQQVRSFFINDQGQLILELKYDTGSMIFD